MFWHGPHVCTLWYYVHTCSDVIFRSSTEHSYFWDAGVMNCFAGPEATLVSLTAGESKAGDLWCTLVFMKLTLNIPVPARYIICKQVIFTSDIYDYQIPTIIGLPVINEYKYYHYHIPHASLQISYLQIVGVPALGIHQERLLRLGESNLRPLRNLIQGDPERLLMGSPIPESSHCQGSFWISV